MLETLRPTKLELISKPGSVALMVKVIGFVETIEANAAERDKPAEKRH